MTNIQRIVDALSDELARPAAVDDADFRLLFYSPQRGPLDMVRMQSILQRDAPHAAKEWVLSRGVKDAVGVHRLSGSAEVGLLPRAYIPIRHTGTLLGYLWILDADETLSTDFDGLIATAAEELGPLLYRRRTLDLLARRRERELVRQLLLVDDNEQRRRSAADLQDRGVLHAGTQPCVVVIEALVSPGHALDQAEELALEATLERSRGWVADTRLIQALHGPRGVIVLARRGMGSAELGPQAFAQKLADEGRRRIPGRRIVVGIGSTRSHLSDAHRSYVEATATTRILARVPELGDVLLHDDLGVYATIARLPEAALTTELVPPAVRALLHGDQDGELTTTLEAFLCAAGDVARVAEELHLHRSTVYARLRRIERVAQGSLSDGHTRLTLHLGLALARTVQEWPRRRS